jgi:hypothetical protein
MFIIGENLTSFHLIKPLLQPGVKSLISLFKLVQAFYKLLALLMLRLFFR